MEIKVKCNCGEKCPEWAIVELQGVVEVQPQFQDRLQNLQIGHLCRPSSQEVYTFTVGYHELTGTKVPLKKPLLVLKKVKHPSGDDADSVRVELEVIGIIRHRILFKTRPRALISMNRFWFIAKSPIKYDFNCFPSEPQPTVKGRAGAPDSIVPTK